MNFGQISGHLPGFAHFQKPGFDQQKPSIYKGTEKLPFFEWEFLYLAFLGFGF